MTADEVIRRLRLHPHPEGGHYRETFRHTAPDGGRGALTVIYFLLRAGERSAWHRVDATEVWHHYAGSALLLHIVGEEGALRTHVLGADPTAGQDLHAVVPSGCWQSAEPQGGWSLAGCTVAPAFEFSGFEMAPEGWTPVLAKD